MNANIKRSYQSIFGSEDGLHLSVYINFDGNLKSFEDRLRDLIEVHEEHLAAILPKEGIKKFLAPIIALTSDRNLMSHVKGSLAIFRKGDFFRIVSIPIQVDDNSALANTFHIKPLLKWLQSEQNFLVLNLQHSEATLFKGNEVEFKKIGTLVYPAARLGLVKNKSTSLNSKLTKKQIEPITRFLVDSMEEFTSSSRSILFVVGHDQLLSSFVKDFSSELLYPETIEGSFLGDDLTMLSSKIRSVLRREAQDKIAETLEEFEQAQSLKTAKTNIFLIAKAAVRGQVRKLIVAEDFNVFGRLDKATGGLSLHPIDLNHEDDCLLDDIAQAVLLSGGEVTVVKKSEIPDQKPLLAIFNRSYFEYQPDLHRLSAVAI